jgi:hypothetical protein
MPALRSARDAINDVAPQGAHLVGREGSVVAFTGDAAARQGFERVDAARRRILAAVRFPLDGFPPADQL